MAANESVRGLLETTVQNQLFLRAKMQGRSISVALGGTAIPLSNAPVPSASSFENQIKVTLPANSTIALQLYPPVVAGTAVLVGAERGHP